MARAALFVVVGLVGCQEYEGFVDLREQSFTETFEIGGAKTDILFYADTSSSMQRELIELGASFEDFMQRLVGAEDDWQILAVTGPEGCGNGGILTPDTPEYAEKFAIGIATPPGRDDVDEWGLFNARQAILRSVPGACNAGFMRDGAVLHVVFLADERDSSPGYELGGDYWRDYTDTIVYAKGDAERVRFSAVVGPPNGGCAGAEPGTGYADAALSNGGEVLSICDDWDSQIDILADASVTRDTFPLAHEPVLDSIRVQQNGEDRAGWHYDAVQVAVVLTEDLPRADDVVTVQYRAFVDVAADTADDGS
jgi:hypothetical protein